MAPEKLTGTDRCWSCTVANAVVGALVGLVPIAAALVNGDPTTVVGAVVWGVAVTGFTIYRLVARGYLPLAEQMAKWTGLHGHVGPGTHENEDRRR